MQMCHGRLQICKLYELHQMQYITAATALYSSWIVFYMSYLLDCEIHELIGASVTLYHGAHGSTYHESMTDGFSVLPKNVVKINFLLKTQSTTFIIYPSVVDFIKRIGSFICSA